MKRINAWSSPRNISTAFMYAFAQRADTTVVDEPLYAHYLSTAGEALAHPGTPEILESQEREGQRVIEEVLFGDYPTEVVLFKQMTHHLLQLSWDFLTDMNNIMLIRNPREIIASYAKVIPHPTIQDVGVELQYELFRHLRQIERLDAVIDARELLLNPTKVLRQLCDRLELSFEEDMLRWEAGPRPEDGVWAKHWYHRVHQSTGFQPFVERQIVLPPHLEKLADRCRPYYEALFPYAIKN